MESAMNLKIEADHLRIEIEFLLAQYPDLRDDEDLRADMLEGETQITKILTALHRYREDSKKLANGSQEQLDALIARKKRLTLRVEFLRKLMQSILFAADIRKIELPECTLSIRNNPQQVLGEADVDELPEDLIRIKREPDRQKIREALLQGRHVPGCILNNAPPSLNVKI
jgi:hypothetical protein